MERRIGIGSDELIVVVTMYEIHMNPRLGPSHKGWSRDALLRVNFTDLLNKQWNLSYNTFKRFKYYLILR